MPKSLSTRAGQVKDLALSSTAKNTTIIGLTNLGLDTAAIKLISTYLEKNRHRAAVIMKMIFYLEILCGVAIIVAGAIFAPMIAEALGGTQLTFAVRLAFLASAFGSAAAFIGPFFIAYQRFVANTLVGLIGGVLRVVLILILVGTVGLNLENSLWAYTLVPIVFFFAGLALTPKDWTIKTTRVENRSALREIYHFSKWILLSYFATVIAGRIDVFLLSHYKGTESVGLYTAALQLASVTPLLIAAITTVLLPKVSRMSTRAEFTSYIKKAAFGSLVLGLALLPVLLFSDVIIALVFGDKYLGALPAFKLMFLGYLIALVTNPIGLVVYAMDKPKVFTILNYVQLVVTVVLNFVLIPTMGIVGPALAFVISNLIGGVGGMTYAIRKVREL
jgi:O-antigen/teichoic acid export membrane protein